METVRELFPTNVTSAGLMTGPASVAVFTTDELLLESLGRLLPTNQFQLSARRRTDSLGRVISDRRTDAVLLDLSVAPLAARAAVAQRLRDMKPRPQTPLVGLCNAELPQQERLLALQDGLWDVFELPGQGDSLAAKLGTWVLLKRDIDGLRSGLLVDVETGHYSAQGLKRRLRELVALTQRTDDSLSCVVFGPDREPAGGGVDDEMLLDVGRRFSLALHHGTRNSDVVGRLEPLKFMVLAPHTVPAGAVRMAERFTSMSWLRHTAGEYPLSFGAGVAGVDGKNGQLQACPELLVAAASRALNEARIAGAAQVVMAWREPERSEGGTASG